MAKRIETTGKANARIEVTGRPNRRIEREKFGVAVGGEPVANGDIRGLDAISLAGLAGEMFARLKSSGGRPSLSDATQVCRVPLSAEDVEALKIITNQLAETTGSKPSTGQVASIAVRRYLNVCFGSGKVPISAPQETAWPEEWNGNREKYTAAQEVILRSGTTWGSKRNAA